MNSITGIGPLAIGDLGSSEYDLVIAALGYEQRATFVPSLVADRAAHRIALGFSDGFVHNFRRNRRWFRLNRFDVPQFTDREFLPIVLERIEEAASQLGDKDRVHICVDISSFSRRRLAEIIEAATVASSTIPLVVDFAYSRAKFSKPPLEYWPPQSIGPVSEQFRGSVRYITRPRSAIVGIGYEYELAAGVIERLEATDVWSFQPISADCRYDDASDQANEYLWLVIPENRRLRYRIEQPADAFVNLESLVYGLASQSNPVLVPFGPKIFTLCCLLVGVIYRPMVEVWRVATSPNPDPIDRKADGMVCGLRVELSPPSTDVSDVGLGQSVIRTGYR